MLKMLMRYFAKAGIFNIFLKNQKSDYDMMMILISATFLGRYPCNNYRTKPASEMF